MEINRLTHTKDDLCGIQTYFKQSVGPGRYATTYLVPDATKVNSLSVESQMLYPVEGFGMNNKKIDDDSVMRNEPGFKSNRCNTRAQARPFMTVRASIHL